MKKLDKESVIGITALLIHAANIDEIYSNKEKKLIMDFINSYLKDDDANKILKEAEEIESNSNQLLNYTNIIKENPIEIKKGTQIKEDMISMKRPATGIEPKFMKKIIGKITTKNIKADYSINWKDLS